MIKTKCPEDAAVLKNFIEQDRVYDFLVGLNSEFDQVRVQILGKQEIPCFNEVVALVRGEESRRGLILICFFSFFLKKRKKHRYCSRTLFICTVHHYGL